MAFYDVIIVGAGPVGSHVAREVALKGYSVAVFEEHGSVGMPVQCTGIIGTECTRRYGIPDEVISARSKSAMFFSPSGSYIRMATDEVQACIVDRCAMDIYFADKARSAGACYNLARRVVDVSIRDDRVLVAADSAEGVSLFEARIVVIAGGFGTRLPYKLGLGRFGDWIAGAQMEVETGAGEVEVYFSQKTAPGFFGWLVPTGSGKGLAGLFSRRTPRRYLDSMIDNLTAKGKITGRGKITSGGIPLKPLPRTYAQRLLVVGDAAGQVKPTTGGGVYYGLICADIAAVTIAQALSSGDFSQKALGNYQKGWRKAIGRELSIGYMARRFYEKLSDSQIELFFRMLRSHGVYRAILSSDKMRFDWHGGLLLQWLKYIGPWRYFFGWSKDSP